MSNRMEAAKAAFWSTPDNSTNAIENAVHAWLGEDSLFLIDLSNERQVDMYQFGGYLRTLKQRRILVRVWPKENNDE